MRVNSFLLILTLALVAMNARAQEYDTTVRPVLSAYTVEAGSSHIAETYLSPLQYSGWSSALNYERMQAMRFSPERWVMQLKGRVALDRTLNPARNAAIWNTGLTLGWAMMRRFNPGRGWSLFAGGCTGISLGAYYSERNSNNPVAAKADWTVGVQAAAAYTFHLRRFPVTLRYQLEMPLAGVFFSPEYGELYYEIYMGNHKGLLRGAWPGNFFRMNNLLTADLRFGGTIVRLGYRFDARSSKASDIVTRHFTHTAVVGFCADWLTLSPRLRLDPDVRIINALY